MCFEVGMFNVVSNCKDNLKDVNRPIDIDIIHVHIIVFAKKWDRSCALQKDNW